MKRNPVLGLLAVLFLFAALFTLYRGRSAADPFVEGDVSKSIKETSVDDFNSRSSFKDTDSTRQDLEKHSSRISSCNLIDADELRKQMRERVDKAFKEARSPNAGEFFSESVVCDGIVEIYGKVTVSSLGEPLTGAEVSVLSLNETENGKSIPRRVFVDSEAPSMDEKVRTNSAGEYRMFIKMPASYLCKAEITISSFLIKMDSEYIFGKGKACLNSTKVKIDIHILAPGSIFGEVRNKDGCGIADINVTAFPWMKEIDRELHGRIMKNAQGNTLTVTTNSNGKFSFPRLSSGIYFIEIGLNQKGYLFQRYGGDYEERDQPKFMSENRAQIVLDGGDKEVNFLAVGEPSQKILVKNESGSPVKGARCKMVAVRPTHEGSIIVSTETVTDNDGKGRLSLPEETNHGWAFKALVLARGYEFKYQIVYFDRNRTEEIILDKPGRILSGIVQDTEGNPIEDVGVVLYYDLNNDPDCVNMVFDEIATDENGRFEFNILSAESRHEIDIREPSEYEIQNKEVIKKEFRAGDKVGPVIFARD